MTAVAAAARAEWARLRCTPLDLALLTLLPAVLLGLMAAMIFPGTLTGLGVVVVDRDGGPVARGIVRHVAASPSLALVAATPDIGAALAMVRREAAVAVLVIPRGVGSQRPGGQPVEILHQSQFLSNGTLTATYVEVAVAGALAAAAPRDRGLAGLAGLRGGSGPGLSLTVPGNPTLSFEWYLGLLLGPGILHLLIAVTVIGAAGAAGGRAVSPAGLAIPHVAIGTLWGIGWLLWLTLARGYRPAGDPFVLAAGLLLLFAATAAVALLLLALLREVSTALSAAVIVAGSALAYSGASLPIDGAGAVARGWSALLPLTHYLRLQMDVVAGAAPAPILREAGVLLLYPIVAGGAATVLLNRRAKRA